MNLSLVQTGTVMRSDFRQPRRRTGAFSLLELMIAVGLLTIIVAALYAMFDQTQKAFRQSLNQADLSEGGRSALDLMVRTIERAASPQVDDALHLVVRPANATGYELVFAGDATQANRTQPLRFDELFFTYPASGGRWHVGGLFIGTLDAGPVVSTPVTGLGSLYLYDEALPNSNLVQVLDGQGRLGARVRDLASPATVPPYRLTGTAALRTNLITGRLWVPTYPAGETREARRDAVKLLEGVLQCRITAFDADGRPFDANHPVLYDVNFPRVGVNTNVPRHYPVTPVAWRAQGTNVLRPLPIEVINVNSDTAQVSTLFRGPNLPASIEIEITLLDGKQLDQFRSLPDNVQARNRWLANNAGALQTLRQRVVLRTAPQ